MYENDYQRDRFIWPVRVNQKCIIYFLIIKSSNNEDLSLHEGKPLIFISNLEDFLGTLK